MRFLWRLPCCRQGKRWLLPSSMLVSAIAVTSLFSVFACAATTQPAGSKPDRADLTLPMLIDFELDWLPSHDKKPWIVAKILSANILKANSLGFRGSNVYQVKVLACLYAHGQAIPKTIILSPGDGVASTRSVPSPPLPINADLDLGVLAGCYFRPGEEALVAQLGKKEDSSRLIFTAFPRGPVYYLDERHVIPSQFADELAPAWLYYNAHRKVFAPKPTASDKKLLVKLLSGKNIFLAKQAWPSLLKTTHYDSVYTKRSDTSYAPLTRKFVEHLFATIGPEREAYFIYTAFDCVDGIGHLNPAMLATRGLVDKATKSSKLLPIATACAYISAWNTRTDMSGDTSTGVSLARSLLQKIQKKVTGFKTHTDADKRIEAMIQFAKPPDWGTILSNVDNPPVKVPKFGRK